MAEFQTSGDSPAPGTRKVIRGTILPEFTQRDRLRVHGNPEVSDIRDAYDTFPADAFIHPVPLSKREEKGGSEREFVSQYGVPLSLGDRCARRDRRL